MARFGMSCFRRITFVVYVALVSAASAGTLALVPGPQYLDDPLAVDGLDRPAAIVVSPDGVHVYVASPHEDAIGVFGRDAGTGALTFVEAHADGVAGVDGLDGVAWLAVSPDGAHLYAASPGNMDASLVTFGRDAGTGALTFLSQIGGGGGPLALSADGAHLYVESFLFPGAPTLSGYGRDAGTGALTLIDTETDGVGGVQGLGWDGGVAVSPDGTAVYVASDSSPSVFNLGAIARFARNPVSGALAFANHLTFGVVAGGGAGPDAVAVSPDGLHVHVATQPSSTAPAQVSAYTLGPTLALPVLNVNIGADFYGPPLFRAPDSISVTPDGTHVVLASGGNDDHRVVTVYRRNPTDGELTYSQGLRLDGPPGAFAHALSPDGKHVYVASGCSALPTACATDFAVAVVRLVPICPPAPTAGCLAVPRSRAALVVQDRTETKQDLLRWTWTRGAAASLSDVGDPTTTSSYALCLYDASGSPLRRELLTPAGGNSCRGALHHRQDCWKTAPGSRFTYDDRDGLTPDAVSTMRIRSGPSANNLVLAKGLRLDPASFLPLVPPVRAQLRNVETGACWDATFSAPKRSSAVEFRARSD